MDDTGHESSGSWPLTLWGQTTLEEEQRNLPQLSASPVPRLQEARMEISCAGARIGRAGPCRTLSWGRPGQGGRGRLPALPTHRALITRPHGQ